MFLRLYKLETACFWSSWDRKGQAGRKEGGRPFAGYLTTQEKTQAELLCRFWKRFAVVCIKAFVLNNIQKHITFLAVALEKKISSFIHQLEAIFQVRRKFLVIRKSSYHWDSNEIVDVWPECNGALRNRTFLLEIKKSTWWRNAAVFNSGATLRRSIWISICHGKTCRLVIYPLHSCAFNSKKQHLLVCLILNLLFKLIEQAT